jgi:hypothetical protein
VRLLEMPHTEENFLMREMGYQVARAHAARLRAITHVALFLAPIALIALIAAGVRPDRPRPAAWPLVAVVSAGRGHSHRALAVLRRGAAHLHALLWPSGLIGPTCAEPLDIDTALYSYIMK